VLPDDVRVTALRRAIDAKHIAVFGASATPGKWGNNVPLRLLQSGFAGILTLVNPRGGEACGLPLMNSEAAAGADLAIIATPAPTVPNIVRDCARLNIPTAVVPAGGFGEVGNISLHEELMSAVVDSHVRVIGPNCFGLFVGGTGLNVTTIPYLPTGSISCISQSGGVIQQVGMRLARLGYGYDVVLALGNKCDVGFADGVAAIARRETTSTLLLYLERFDEGNLLLDTLAEARNSVSIVCLIGGRTDVGRRTAQSHTSSLAGSWERLRAVLSDMDVLVVDDMQHAAAAAVGGTRSAPRRGRRVFALYDGGGHSVLVSDHLRSAGFIMPTPRGALAAALSQVQRPSNPFDFGATDPRRVLTEFPRLLEKAATSEQYDAIVLGPQLGGGYKALVGDELEELEAATLDKISRIVSGVVRCSVVIQTLHAPEPSPSLVAVRSASIPCVEWPSEVVDVLQAQMGVVSTPHLGDDSNRFEADEIDRQYNTADPALVALVDRVRGVFDAKLIDHCLGKVVTISDLPTTSEGRWVLRADGFAHKTRASAIRLNLKASELLAHYVELSKIATDAGLTPVIRLAPFLAHDQEWIVSFWRSPREGSGFLIGRGGTSVENSPDIALGRMPRSVSDIVRILDKTTRGSELRRRDGVMATTLAEAVLKMAEAFSDDLTELEELECNPLTVVGDTVYVMDILPKRAGVAPLENESRRRPAD
jgi:succinyl-CoA synthetase alpha subunit